MGGKRRQDVGRRCKGLAGNRSGVRSQKSVVAGASGDMTTDHVSSPERLGI